MTLVKIGLAAGIVLFTYGIYQIHDPVVNMVTGAVLVITCGWIFLASSNRYQ